MVQLAEKHRKEEATNKAQAVRNAAKLAEQQKRGEEESEGQKSPLPEPETDTEKGGTDLQTTSTQLKHL